MASETPQPPQAGSGGRRQRFFVSVAMRLPRDRESVPVVRHIARDALREVGVVPDDAEDIQLALAEATANVLDHAGPGDAYDVTVEISPGQCDIRVVDVGRGFDHESLSAEMAEPTAERGRGIALMRALMDQVRFQSRPETGTVVHLVKALHFDENLTGHQLFVRQLAS